MWLGDDEKLRLLGDGGFDIFVQGKVAAGFSLEEEEENGSVFGWRIVSLSGERGFEIHH